METLANVLTGIVADGGFTAEGYDLIVVTDDLTAALAVAPTLAARLHPDRRFGEVLHHEQCGGAEGDHAPAHWHIVVRDLGPQRGEVVH
jgi:hypothetical protein